MTGGLPHVRRPCDKCPWRADAQPGRFPLSRWEALADSTVRRPDGAQPRLAVARGELDGAQLRPGAEWPALHPSLLVAAAHDLGFEL